MVWRLLRTGVPHVTSPAARRAFNLELEPPKLRIAMAAMSMRELSAGTAARRAGSGYIANVVS